ncbi:TonB-dependent receptor domain-containing protein [Novispirillum itersonii]|uniref:TonB-dependent receptor domain-containing protein n=1 Tax=Novispirillum itersonii TaxID=189 RepID=UPI00037ECD09|nr:TonB-dependent receptor [Novispirillum itersonii]
MSRTPFLARTACAALPLLALLPVCAQAEQTLTPMTVTATRTERDPFEVPAAVTVLTREQMDEAQASSLQILRTIPGVNMGGGARAAGQIPSVRGLQGPRVILSVDGARRNHVDGIRSPLLIDPDMVQQVDVMRGPASALYGSGGIGGVIALRTLEAGDILQDGRTHGGRIRTSYRSGDESFSSNLTGAAQAQGFALLGSTTLREAGDIHTGASDDLLSDDQLRTGLLKGSYSPNDLHKIQLSYQRFNDRLLTPSNPGGTPAFGLLQQLRRQQDEMVGSYAFRDADRSLFDGKITVYNTRLHFKTLPYTSGVNPTDVVTETTGVSAQNSSRFETASWLKHRVTYGIDAYQDAQRNRDGAGINAVTPDGEQTSVGTFIQNEMTVADQWTLTGALRNDTYSLAPKTLDDSSVSRVSPKLTLHWQPNEVLGLFGGYSEAFRAPTLSESYQNLNTTRALFNFRPNDALKPETSKTWEGGMTLSFRDVIAPGDQARFKGVAFTEEVDDLITSSVIGTYTRAAPFSGTGSVFQNRNVSKAKRHGMELEAGYTTGPLELGAGYARIRSEDGTTGDNLFAPPDTLSLSTRYQFDDNWSGWWLGQFVAAQDYDATLARQRSGYGLHSLGVAYDQDWWRADLNVSNLFDQTYVTYQQSQTTTYTYEEGRSINLSLTARF